MNFGKFGYMLIGSNYGGMIRWKPLDGMKAKETATLY